MGTGPRSEILGRDPAEVDFYLRCKGKCGRIRPQSEFYETPWGRAEKCRECTFKDLVILPLPLATAKYLARVAARARAGKASAKEKKRRAANKLSAIATLARLESRRKNAATNALGKS